MNKLNVVWTENAKVDLQSIIEYIKIDSTQTAKNIFLQIKKECQELEYMPERKRVVPELQNIGVVKYREVIYKRWRVVFKVEASKVYVLIVVDSSRNLEDLLFQRLIRK